MDDDRVEEGIYRYKAARLEQERVGANSLVFPVELSNRSIQMSREKVYEAAIFLAEMVIAEREKKGA
jgi:hypothetical protein